MAVQPNGSRTSSLRLLIALSIDHLTVRGSDFFFSYNRGYRHLRRVAANRRNILFISQNRSWGGSETWWYRLALEARGRGFRASILARFYPDNRRYLNDLAAHGVRVH